MMSKLNRDKLFYSDIKISTYFRNYYLDSTTGDATSVERLVPPLFFLTKRLRRRKASETYSIYDYFATKEHALQSILDSKELVELLKRMDVNLEGNVLDISGGNGVVLNELMKLYPINKGFLTEVNQMAIDYAIKLGLYAVMFDFEKDDVSQLANRFAGSSSEGQTKFDFVLLRACIMFCPNLSQFLEQLAKIMTPNGKVIIQHSVEFTVGMALRTQLDDSSYKILRSTSTVKKEVDIAGFRLSFTEHEIDPTMYVYENDRSVARRLLHIIYEQKMIKRLRKSRSYFWAARDRRRNHYLIFK
jgi:SAM-dependent methyltransferase